jgi:hypothetical protein
VRRAFAAGAARASLRLEIASGIAKGWWNGWVVPNWRRHCQPLVDRAVEWTSEQSRRGWALAKAQRSVLRQFLGEKWAEARAATEPHRAQVRQVIQPTLDMASAQLGPALIAVRSAAGPAYSMIANSTAAASLARAVREWEIRALTGVAGAADVAKGYLVLRRAPEMAVRFAAWVQRAALADAASLQRPAPATASSLPPPFYSARLCILNAALAIAAAAALLRLARLAARSAGALVKYRGRSVPSSSPASRQGGKPFSPGWKLR